MRSKKVLEVIVLICILFVLFGAASGSARSLTTMGGQVTFCHYDPLRKVVRQLTVPYLTWQVLYSYHADDCCLSVQDFLLPAIRTAAAKECAARSCDLAHMSAACACVQNYAFDTATRSCRASAPSEGGKTCPFPTSSFPPHTDFWSWSEEDEVNGRLVDGAVCKLWCKPGFKPSSPTTTCINGEMETLSCLPICQSLPSPPLDGGLEKCVGPDGLTNPAAPYAVGTVCAFTCAGGKLPSGELQCVDANTWSSGSCVDAYQDCALGIRGSGVCANDEGCCSPLGYCDTSEACTNTTYDNAQFPGGFVMLNHTNMTATASSSWQDIADMPSRAVDGNTNANYYIDSSCFVSGTATTTNDKQWLLIDMHASQQVAGVRITNRQDFNPGLFRLWEIRVGDAATLPADNTAIDQLALCRQDTDPTRPGALVYQVLCSQVLTGRYMAIRNGCDGCYLQVCEVQPFVHL